MILLVIPFVSATETIQGTVTNTPTSEPIQGVTGTLRYSLVFYPGNTTVLGSTTTDANGLYSLTFDINETSVLNLSLSKPGSGYLDDTTFPLVTDEETRQINRVMGPVMTNTIGGRVTNVCDSSTINGATLTMTGNEVFTTLSGAGDVLPGEYTRFVLNASS